MPAREDAPVRSRRKQELLAMTPQQITLVQESFRYILPKRDEAAAIFYRRLFAIDPELRQLFSHAEMTGQGHKLMVALAFVVNGLAQPETIAGAAQALARRHVGYGVRDLHYASVGQALVETLEEGLGSAFDEPVREAWMAAYAFLSRIMIAAALETTAAAQAPALSPD
jgi:hemoglobin-like flavoprotein